MYLSTEIDNLFKCKICHKPEQVSRLSYHARNEHNIQDISEATRVCLNNNKDSINNNEDILKSSIEPNIDFPDIEGNVVINRMSTVQRQLYLGQLPFFTVAEH